MSDAVKIEDFGFSLVGKDEMTSGVQKELDITANQLQKTHQKLMGLKDMIWPLLVRLKSDPTKTHIEWPNRVEVVSGLMRRIENYVADEKTEG